MDEFRYLLGGILILIMPVVVTFWLVIHLGSSFWRSRAGSLAYWTAGVCISVVVGCCVYLFDTLIGVNFGTNWFLFVVGFSIYMASWFLWRPVKRHLDFKTFAGVPEVTNQRIELISDGPFRLVRHPRYLMVLIGILGWCLMSNYSGVYLMGIFSFLGLLLIIKLEERDLIARFGNKYLNYRREVPGLIPSRVSLKRFLADKI